MAVKPDDVDEPHGIDPETVSMHRTPSSPGDPPTSPSCYSPSMGDEEEENLAMSDFLYATLQELHPGIRVSTNALSALRGIVDGLTVRILEEAAKDDEDEHTVKRERKGPPADVGGVEAAGDAPKDPHDPSRGGACGVSGAPGEPGSRPQSPQSPHHHHRSAYHESIDGVVTRSRKRKAMLSSLEVHRAVKRVLPGAGEPGRVLRPYLPGVVKQARHMDKTQRKNRARRDVG